MSWRPGSSGGPQWLDSIVRTTTTSALALVLVGVVAYLAISTNGPLSSLTAVLVGWAGVVVGFYFGGHVAQNTAQAEEARQREATAAAEGSAARSEASAVRSEGVGK